MAIAGLVILGVAERMEALRDALAQAPDIVDVQDTGDALRLAAVLEVPADKVESRMSALLEWESVVAVDLAFLNYEDDLAAGGEIPCAPHKKKQR